MCQTLLHKRIIKISKMYKRVFSCKPKKMWIDGKCFDIMPYKDLNISATSTSFKIQESTNSATGSNFKIDEISNNKLETVFRIPSIYYERLNDFSNFNIKKLAEDTNTEITVPKSGSEGYLNINGSNISDIINARKVIHSALIEIKEGLKVTHFISIPVHTEEIQKNFEVFKKSVLENEQIKGMDATMFQSSMKLHLTLGVFSLMDDFEKAEAVAVLNDCNVQVIEPLLKGTTLKIKVAGIDCMNANLKKTHILYAKAKIEGEGKEEFLQNLSNKIAEYFYERGLIQQYQDNVKLHVTLLNTKYKFTRSSPNKPRWSDRRPFDATSLIEKYNDFYFGESVLDSVHLSYMSSVGEDGFYKPLAIIKF